MVHKLDHIGLLEKRDRRSRSRLANTILKRAMPCAALFLLKRRAEANISASHQGFREGRSREVHGT